MNILKWLKNKTGKLPISLAQAAGLTAVVGAAGFATMSYLSSPADNNTAFIPPAVYEQQGDVVYVSQSGGGGQYEANGEVQSTFRARQSDAIRLANQQFERENQTRALEEADIQPSYAEQEDAVQMPKAYQLGGADVGLGMGGSTDKQLNGSLDMFSTLQNQISNVGNAVNAQLQQTAAGPQGTTQTTATPGANATAGQTAAQLASAPRNWGQGGLTRAGSGGNSNNAFVIQNSRKNQGDREAAAALEEAGNLLASTREAMGRVTEGTRIQSRANFGSSDRLGVDRNADGQGARRRYGNAKSELEWIRKRSADINANKTNSANEGGRPFLSSAQISGGLVVDGENVTTGQNSSSNDLRSTADRQMRGAKAGLAKAAASIEEKKLAKMELLNKFFSVFSAAILGIVGIAVLVKAAKLAVTPWVKAALFVAAAVLTALTLGIIWLGLAPKIKDYVDMAGSDGWSIFGYAMSGVLSLGVGAAWLFGPKVIGEKTYASLKLLSPLLGFGAVGYSAVDMLTNKDDYLKEIEEANSGTSETQEQNEQDTTGQGGN